jgi:chemotaxis protein methyltransferase CheR
MSGVQALRPASFETYASLLRRASGLVIGVDKIYLLQARLAPIARQLGVADLDALAERLRVPGAAALQQRVVEAMTTNETFFFRDEKPFAHVSQHALARLHSKRPPGVRIRIWSAAASSGQEAYSLAMIVADQRARLAERGVDIIGTDIARVQLARAREGLYTQFEVQRGLPMQLLVKYFRKDGTQWRIADALRAAVQFREFNLLGDLRPLGQFDLVFCRNVLIYFDTPTKSRVLAAIAAQLAPDGLLYLGGAETVIGISDRFTAHGNERGVYECVPAMAPLVRAG